MAVIYSTGQVSRLVGVRPYQISYAIVTGRLPEPTFRFLNNRCFTEAAVRKVAEHFGVAGSAVQAGRAEVAEPAPTAPGHVQGVQSRRFDRRP
jgi:hypothetical protein